MKLRLSSAGRALTFAAALLLAACATGAGDATGTSPVFSEGFTAGCDSGYASAGYAKYSFRKDSARYRESDQYRRGWKKGFATCQRRYGLVD